MITCLKTGCDVSLNGIYLRGDAFLISTGEGQGVENRPLLLRLCPADRSVLVPKDMWLHFTITSYDMWFDELEPHFSTMIVGNPADWSFHGEQG
jgi:hypothetical protein